MSTITFCILLQLTRLLREHIMILAIEHETETYMKTGITKKMILVLLALIVALGAGSLLLKMADKSESESVKLIGFYEDSGNHMP